MKVMQSFKVLTLCLLSFLIFTPVSYAGNFVVGVENIDYYPFFSVKKQEYVGYSREFLDAFAKAKGHSLTYKPLPVNRLFKDFVNKKIDFKYPDNPYWQSDIKKNVKVFYSNPVVDYIDGVMVLPENQGKGVDAIKKLGTVAGFTAWDWLDRINSKKVRVVENTNFTSLLKQILMKRVDGAYINVAVASYHLDASLKKPGAVIFDPELPHTQSSYFLSTVKHPGVVEELNAFIADNQALIKRLKEKYQVEKGR